MNLLAHRREPDSEDDGEGGGEGGGQGDWLLMSPVPRPRRPPRTTHW